MKRIVLFSALILLSSAMHTQDLSNSEKKNQIIIDPYETSDLDNCQKLEERISTALDFSVEKWIVPEFGLRIQYLGLKDMYSTNSENNYAKNSLEDGFYSIQFNISNLQNDLSWNKGNKFNKHVRPADLSKKLEEQRTDISINTIPVALFSKKGWSALDKKGSQC